jgi:DNA repair photolyase
MGTNTDPYQPIEKTWKVTRAILEVLERTGHPVGIVTKSALVTRDIDILSRMASRGLAKVAVSVTTLDAKLARSLEPRAATPSRRIDALRQLSAAGIPTSVLVAPIIPSVNDMEIERILDAAHAAGVREGGYILLRLPLEVRDLMQEWLAENRPEKLRHVMSLVRDTRDGKDYDSRFGARMTGTGPYAWMIGRRFELAASRLSMNLAKARLRTDLFQRPARVGEQLALL